MNGCDSDIKQSVYVDVVSFVNLALVQNGLPVVQGLRLVNDTEEPLREVVCSFSSEDELIVPAHVVFREIMPGKIAFRQHVDVLLNQRRVLEVVDEPFKGEIVLSVSISGDEVFSKSYPLTVLPANQWTGLRPYTELLAAYVFPNDELVCRLQSEAADAIERSTGRSSLEGYQGGKRRVLEMCAAIYGVAQQMGLRYGTSPATFGQPGQRIRLLDEIEKYKLASCLESSLLLASVMERCGLFPVLVLTETHCYVGCHLLEEGCKDVVVHDVQALRKLAALDEFVAFETTGITSDMTFNEAEEIGRGYLENEKTFVCAVDIVRCRETGICTLTLGKGFDSVYTATGRVVSVSDNGSVRMVKESIDLSTLKQVQTAQTRIARWTQKLLDFSARNRLLNIPRSSRQVIRLMCSSVANLEDKIAANQTITIRSIADSMGEKAFNDLIDGRMTREQCAKIVDVELSHERLCVMMSPQEVAKRLTSLLHDARMSLEESGVNTLFLTIGELQWVPAENYSNCKSYRAPILMIPVRLERTSMAEGVKMYRLDEDTTLNATLMEFLRTQFNLLIPGLDPLPVDESGVDVPRILQIFRQAIKERQGWEVFDEATVGCFSFGKFVMWKDLAERSEDLQRNPLVSHLIGGGGFFDDGVEVFPADEVAKHFDPGKVFCPISYDASQLAAVLYSEMGKSFVLHGPPGTGKSQTITNIIAHNLAQGRRVLFVSEKKAALDVVKERLDRIGLAPFCLELHSNKTEKRKFYEQIKLALDTPDVQTPSEWEQTLKELESCRQTLDEYIQALHHVYPNGLTAYECFSQQIQGSYDDSFNLLEVDCLTHSREAYREVRQLVQVLLADSRRVSPEALEAIPPLKITVWSPAVERQLRISAEEFVLAARALGDAMAKVYILLGLEENWSLKMAQSLVEALSSLHGQKWISKRFGGCVEKTTVALLKDLLDLQRRHEACVRALESYRMERVAALGFGGVAQRLAQNRQCFVLIRYFRNRALLRELDGLVKLGAPKLTIARLVEDLPVMREAIRVERAFKENAGCALEDRVVVGSELREACDRVLELWPEFQKKLSEVEDFVHEGLFDEDWRKGGERCEALIRHLGSLRDVLRYRKTAVKAQELGVGGFEAFFAQYDDGALDAARLFDEAYAAKMLDAILSKTPVLAEFSGLAQNERIERFRVLNKRYETLSQSVVFAKLAAALPRRRKGVCPAGTELGALKRECEKKTRQRAVRSMLADSTLISVLKPCFLMSPLSVAQYLPVDSTPFDLIVFDEASQIPVWDAVGVIARGTQLIVVGDPKQMPPTSFFQKGDVETAAEEEEVIADQESILDECLVAGVYSAYLKWHYRSRHESLIAFSNEHYYSNKLCTFPAATSSSRLGIKFIFVPDGVSVKEGKDSSVNRVEANALVDYICSEVLKPDYTPRTLGVVTFSLAQQQLILSLLEERRSRDATLEKLLPEEGEGAYFVKNLENVQGNESDVILFSVGYAPDENGKFRMLFGPLNISGGERRLNVAITRAREQVVVFSSIHGYQIDAGEDGRTRAVGAAHLKAFLEYAERGGPVPVEAFSSRKDDGLVQAVVEFLEENGYKVERDVGSSDYRIDIAVQHPEKPNAYLAGIECDGRQYARQQTVQDRDVNSEQVLRGLGWRMYRVWSVDWQFERERAEQHLLEFLEDARKVAPADGNSELKNSPAVHGPDGDENTTAVAPSQWHSEYKVWKNCFHRLPPSICEPSAQPIILRMAKEIIATEGPICETFLRKRICKEWGRVRLTKRVAEILDRCVPDNVLVTEHTTGRVYWPKGTEVAAYREYRIPSSAVGAKRLLEEIPPEELKNAMCEVLSDFGGCHLDVLYCETGKRFGCRNITVEAYCALEVALELLRSSGMI